MYFVHKQGISVFFLPRLRPTHSFPSSQVNASTLKYKKLIPLDNTVRIKDIPDMGGMFTLFFPLSIIILLQHKYSFLFLTVVANAFNIISPEKTLPLAAHSAEHKKEWVKKISDQLVQMGEINRTRSSTVGTALNTMDTPAVQPSSTPSYQLSATITGTKTLFDNQNHGFTVRFSFSIFFLFSI